jgi:hypothetical protein
MKWPATGALLVLSGLAGCGSQYRPVITPVSSTGPASQASAYVSVFSQPDLVAGTSASTAPPCPAKQYSNPGVVTVVDSSGDSVAATATVGNGPLTFALDGQGANAYTENCDGTLSSMSINGELQTKDVATSTLLPGSAPINALILTGGSYIVEQGDNRIAAMTSSPPTLKLEITNIAPSLINLTGASASQRIYSISQGNSNGGNLAWGSCASPGGTPPATGINGEADGIEIATNSVSSRIPLGVCPVYGVTSDDAKRVFILNRGSGTITVINSQLNQLDTTNASPYVTNGTINLCGGTNPCNAGPVYADFYTPGNLLAVANYDNNTISVIDTSLDVYGNDSSTFGKVLATIPVGSHPAALTVLQDATNLRAYVANEGTPCTGSNDATCTTDGSVSVVSLTSFTVLGTVDLGTYVPNPRSIVSNYNYPAGKVYVSAQNSPYVGVIRTDTDDVSAQILVQGDVVDMHISSQYAAQSATTNSNIQSRSVGSGVP